MKVIKRGEVKAKSWKRTLVCKGVRAFNQGGCGSKLLVEEVDLFTEVDGNENLVVEFECMVCKQRTAIQKVRWIDTFALPKYESWKRKRQEEANRAAELSRWSSDDR